MLRKFVSGTLSTLVVTAAMPVATANADPTCGTNFALDYATNTCKPIYSTPTGRCDPTDGTLIGCVGPAGGWEQEQIPEDEISSFVCQTLFLDGVSVASIEDIMHRLYKPPYNRPGREAGRSVALAIENECPEYKYAGMQAAQQALAGS